MNLEFPRALPKDYIELMREILNARVLKNENYSLRAFARDLKLNPGFLSDILAKRSTLSTKKSEAIAKILFPNTEDQNFFCKLVEIANAKDSQKEILQQQTYNFDSSSIAISNDIYASISDWHSMLFLELMCIKDFKNDLNWIAGKLSISTEQAKHTAENLIATGLVLLENGELKKQYDYLALPNGNKSKNAKDFHKNVLDYAAVSLDEQASETRNFTAAFLHIDTQDIPEISEKIKVFRRELAKQYESNEKADSVYMLSMQLFRTDNPN